MIPLRWCQIFAVFLIVALMTSCGRKNELILPPAEEEEIESIEDLG